MSSAMEDSASDKHLPRMCCILFADRASEEYMMSAGDQKHLVNMARTLVSTDLTVRRAQEWNIMRAHKKIADSCKVWQFRRDNSDRDNAKIRDRVYHHLKKQAGQWRAENGVFAVSMLSKSAKIVDQTMVLARSLSDDQWFFGVIGSVDLVNGTMQPPLDRTLSAPKDKRVLKTLKKTERPRYALPLPRDVTTAYREEVKTKYGRVLPSFQQWFEQRRPAIQKCFPDFVERWKSGPSLSTAVPNPVTVLRFDTIGAGQKRKKPARAASARKKARARTLGGFMVDDDEDSDGDYLPEHDGAAEQAEDEGEPTEHDMAPPIPRAREHPAPVAAPHVEAQPLSAYFPDPAAQRFWAPMFGIPTPPISLPDREPQAQPISAFPPDIPPQQNLNDEAKQNLNGEAKQTQYGAEHVEKVSNRQQALPTADEQQDAANVFQNPNGSKRDEDGNTEAVKQEPAEVIVLDDDDKPEDRKDVNANHEPLSQQHGLPIPTLMTSIFSDGPKLQNEKVASSSGFNTPTNQDAASHIGKLQLDISRRMRKAYPNGCKLELELGGYEYIAVLERKGNPKPEGFDVATSEQNGDEVEDGHLNAFQQTKAAYANGHKTKFSLGDYNYTTIMRKLGSTEQALLDAVYTSLTFTSLAKRGRKRPCMSEAGSIWHIHFGALKTSFGCLSSSTISMICVNSKLSGQLCHTLRARSHGSGRYGDKHEGTKSRRYKFR